MLIVNFYLPIQIIINNKFLKNHGHKKVKEIEKEFFDAHCSESTMDTKECCRLQNQTLPIAYFIRYFIQILCIKMALIFGSSF